MISTAHELLLVDQNFDIKDQKRVDYDIQTSFSQYYEHSIQTLVASRQHTIYVYLDFNLHWAFYHPTLLIAIQRLPSGFISYLNETGEIGLFYLGVSPIDWNHMTLPTSHTELD